MTGAVLPSAPAPCEIRFGQHYPDNNFCLLEVDESILEEITNNRVVIKGSANDEAVLCTESKTFALKNLEISNTVLLLDAEADLSSSSAEVLANINATMEIAQIQPKFDRLRAILENSALNEDNQGRVETYNTNDTDAENACSFDEDKTHPFLSWNWLTQNIQASPRELKNQLERLHAQLINGQYRIIDRAYLMTFLENFLLVTVEKDWSMTSVPIDQLHSSLSSSDYSPDVSDACMKVFADREQDFWKVDMKKLARLKAEQLFADESRWPLEAFLQKWLEDLPSSSSLDLSTLRGMALHDSRFIWCFPADALSAHPATRFKALFLEREKWKREDILPYVENQLAPQLISAVISFLQTLEIPGETIESLILKYCRTIQENEQDPVFYSSRWRIVS